MKLSYINLHPLTLPVDDVDCTKPLTPGHFLIGRKAGFQPAVSDEPVVIIRQVLTSRERVQLAS